MFVLPVSVGRSGVWLGVELIVLTTVLASSVKAVPGNRSLPQRVGSRNMLRELFGTIERRKIQMKILKELDRKRPKSDRATPRPKDLTTEHENNPAKEWFPSPIPDLDRPSFKLAEPSDPYRPDTMKFRISSNVWSHIADVETAVLSFRLKLNKRLRKADRRCKKARLRQQVLGASGNGSINPDAKDALAKKTDTTACVRKSVRKGMKRRRGKKPGRRLKARRVRLVVRLLDVKAKKKRRIYSHEVEVKKTKLVRILISPEKLRNAIEPLNHTVTVQIICRKCRRKVLIDKVFKSSRKHRRRPQRLNPHRPYLIIKTFDMSRSTAATSRSKRHVVNNFCDFSDNYYYDDHETTPAVLENDAECCTDTAYITFEELGFNDWIVYPRGFSTALCLGSCGSGLTQLVPSGESGPQGEKTRDVVNNTNVSSASPQDKQCVPLVSDSSHLDIIYFIDSNTITSGHLENFINNSCGCAR